MRTGKAEIGENAIAHELGHKAVVAGDDARAGVLIGADDPPHVLGIEPRRESRRADEMPCATMRSFGLMGEYSTPMRTWFGPGVSGSGMSTHSRLSTGLPKAVS
jgi:hypothetical protein